MKAIEKDKLKKEMVDIVMVLSQYYTNNDIVSLSGISQSSLYKFVGKLGKRKTLKDISVKDGESIKNQLDRLLVVKNLLSYNVGRRAKVKRRGNEVEVGSDGTVRGNPSGKGIEYMKGKLLEQEHIVNHYKNKFIAFHFLFNCNRAGMYRES